MYILLVFNSLFLLSVSSFAADISMDKGSLDELVFGVGGADVVSISTSGDLSVKSNVLTIDPVNSNHASTKKYVDSQVSYTVPTSSYDGYWEDEKTGFLMQWGEGDILPGIGCVTVTFPTAFENNSYSLVATHKTTALPSSPGPNLLLLSTFGVNSADVCQPSGPGVSPVNTKFTWMAVGKR